MISKGCLVTFEDYANVRNPPIYVVISDPYEHQGQVTRDTFQVVDIFDKTGNGWGPRPILVERLRLISQ